MFTLYYASPDPANGGWAVYSEVYERIDSPEPVEGSEDVVSRNLTKDEAHRLADHRQRQSYGEARLNKTKGGQ